MDYLPIQASSVPSERVFSSSAETDTVRRNRISPVLMEALQMLKFSFKQDNGFNFTAGLVLREGELLRINDLDQINSNDSEKAQDVLNDLVSEEQRSEEDEENVMDIVMRAIWPEDED